MAQLYHLTAKLFEVGPQDEPAFRTLDTDLLMSEAYAAGLYLLADLIGYENVTLTPAAPTNYLAAAQAQWNREAPTAAGYRAQASLPKHKFLVVSAAPDQALISFEHPDVLNGVIEAYRLYLGSLDEVKAKLNVYVDDVLMRFD